MILGHVIALDPTPEQANYFRRACGTARFAYNWGLAQWERLRASNEKPSAQKIKVEGPWPRKHLLGSLKRMQRRISLQKHQAKKLKQKASKRQFKRQLRLSRLHEWISNIRKDAAHKLISFLTRRFQTIVIEDLNVSGMSKNHALAGAILDCGFQEICRQLDYKAEMRNGRILVVDCFFPSSKLCSCCGFKADTMLLSVREWACNTCGEIHDRDLNAAVNLEQIGQARAELTHGDKQPLSFGQPTRKAAWLKREPKHGHTIAHV